MIHKLIVLLLTFALAISGLSANGSSFQMVPGNVTGVLIEDASLRVQDVESSSDLSIFYSGEEPVLVTVESDLGVEASFVLESGETKLVVVDHTAEWRTVTSHGL